MALGRGKYGGIAEELVERFKAKGVIIAIIGVPGFLEAIAKDIRRQAQADAAAVRTMPKKGE